MFLAAHLTQRRSAFLLSRRAFASIGPSQSVKEMLAGEEVMDRDIYTTLTNNKNKMYHVIRLRNADHAPLTVDKATPRSGARYYNGLASNNNEFAFSTTKSTDIDADSSRVVILETGNTGTGNISFQGVLSSDYYSSLGFSVESNSFDPPKSQFTGKDASQIRQKTGFDIQDPKYPHIFGSELTILRKD